MANPLLSLAAAAARWLPAPVKRLLYRLGPVSRGVRAALNRAAPAGLSETTVAGGALSGVKLWLDLQSEKDYWLGTYEPELQQAIRDWVTLGMTVYDLGANVGYISLMLARQVGSTGQVFAFEPLPANQERLRANLALNPQLRVELVPKAVAEKSGPRDFFVHASDDMGKLQGAAGRNTDYQGAIKVMATTQDDFVFLEQNPAPGLVKMDIEGGEAQAFLGMSRVLKEIRPIVLMELHGQDAAEAAWAVLQQAGYSLHLLTHGYPEVQRVERLNWKSYLLAKPAPTSTI
ncbi:MAG: FkbM family methyltransferase [Anaerolineales bacterium]